MKTHRYHKALHTFLLLALNASASAAGLTITVSNLPPRGNTADGSVVALVGTINGWNNNSMLATVTQGRLTYAIADVGSPALLGSEWGDKPDNANAAFQFVVPGSWTSVVKADFIPNEGNFRIALRSDSSNVVEIRAGPVPTLVDQASAVRVNGVVERNVTEFDPKAFAFPGGRWKALVMSYDDGHVQDRGLAQLLREFGIKGTFHLNSSAVNSDTFVTSAEIPSLYAGHEVSSHTVHHPYLDQLDAGGIAWEVDTDRNTLGAWAGYSVRSLSYPFGAFDNLVLSTLRGLAVPCARTVMGTGEMVYFPSDPLKWHPTCHHTGAKWFADQLVARTQEEMALLFVWGHSYELDYGYSDNSWTYMRTLCETLGRHGDIWYASMAEANEYIGALRAVTFPATNVVHNPSGLPVWAKLGGSLCKVQPGKRITFPAGSVSTEPTDPRELDVVTIRYESNGNALDPATNLTAHVGTDGWRDVRDLAMTRDLDGAWTCTMTTTAGVRSIQVAFTDGQGLWDDRGGSDWSIAIEPASTRTPCTVFLAPGSPVVLPPAGGQNNVGQSWDLSTLGGRFPVITNGGFGIFGDVYANYDATNLYLGATGVNPGGSNNAIVLFLSIDTIGAGVENLWSMNSLPHVLDKLHNVALSPAANVAIVLGDEYGDGTFDHFNLSNGSDLGQGVFRLAAGATTFAPVPGVRLAQFDGIGTNATPGADADGDRLTDRWEVAIPWASLHAALGVRSVGSLHLSGLIVSDGVSGSDRYLSSNVLGSGAFGTTDANGNFGFSFITLKGVRVGLPRHDADLDGASDWKESLSGTDAGDAQSYYRAEPGTHASSLRIRSAAGRRHQVEVRDSLTGSSPWLPWGDSVVATGEVCDVPLPIATTNAAFYRVRLLP